MDIGPILKIKNIVETHGTFMVNIIIIKDLLVIMIMDHIVDSLT